jgi:uncharacterized OB-fold protein
MTSPVMEGIFAVEGDRVLGLLAARCGDCGEVTFPFTPRCVGCGAAVERVTLGRAGTVFESTTVHSPAPGFTAPYVVGYVDLPEGVRLFCPLLLPDGREPVAGERAVFETVALSRGGETRLGYGFRVEGREVSG